MFTPNFMFSGFGYTIKLMIMFHILMIIESRFVAYKAHKDI